MILLIAITIAGSESDDLILNQSGNAIDQAITVNHLRNTFPDGLASLVWGFLNSLEFFLALPNKYFTVHPVTMLNSHLGKSFFSGLVLGLRMEKKEIPFPFPF